MTCERCAFLEQELRRTQARLEWQTLKAEQAQYLVDETKDSIDKLIARVLELWEEEAKQQRQAESEIRF